MLNIQLIYKIYFKLYLIKLYLKKYYLLYYIMISEIEQIILYKQLEESLRKQFIKQCPPYPSNTIISDDKVKLKEFQKWYDFWDSKDPHITDINFDFQNRNNKLLLMKKQICGNKKIAILNELKSIGLMKEFIESNMRRDII